MENIPPKSGIIRELSAQLSRRICTGQIIVSLAGACRELIDNAIDAGATNIEIRATENGLECLEVIDNGMGISPSNFEHLCKPHSTSKLSDLEDFRSLTTFGFRGEALNALAALGDVQITTRDANSRCATRLTFGRNGEQLASEQCSRAQGTTVRVAHLFRPLPVRRAEFQRQARREFLRLVDCLQAFAIARPCCRFTCTNSSNGGKRLNILCTPGGPSTRLPQVLDSLFGADGNGQSNGGLFMMEEVVGVPPEECLQLFGVRTNTMAAEFEKIFTEIRLSGYVSSCQSGYGRSSGDRQFIFVNQRHVGFPKLCRIANEVYSQFNRGRFCCLVLFVDVPPHTLDVNISPDKRTVFLHYEKEIFAKFRATLVATFAKCQGRCPIAVGSMSGNEANNGSPEAKKRRTIGSLLHWGENLDAGNGKAAEKQSDQNELATADQTVDDIDRTHLNRQINCAVETQQSVDLSCMTFSSVVNGEEQTINTNDDFCDQNSQQNPGERIVSDWLNDSNLSTKISRKNEKRKTTVKLTAGQKALEAFSFQRLRAAGPSLVAADYRSEQQQTQIFDEQRSNVNDFKSSVQVFTSENETSSSQKTCNYDDCSAEFEFVAYPERCSFPSSSSSSSSLPNPSQCSSSVVTSTLSQPQQQQHQYEFDDEAILFRPQQTVHVDMDILRKNFASRSEQKRRMRHRHRLLVKTATGTMTETDSQLGSEDREAMEQRLSMMLKKTDFARMRLIGQFNNAFIIVRLRSDVFIIDQHAADEKYNFERLLAQSVIKSQQLIRPQHLHLGSVNAALMRDNLHVFRANGFDFQFNNEVINQTGALICENEAEDVIVLNDDNADYEPVIDMNGINVLLNDYAADDGNKLTISTVLLTAVPVLHGWQLNQDDIDQLLSMLTELPGAMHRPTKVRKIFASKACRHSVMFGKALTHREMETIIVNMGSMDQPWNCPHGRPTIRHLCSVERKRDCSDNCEHGFNGSALELSPRQTHHSPPLFS